MKKVGLIVSLLILLAGCVPTAGASRLPSDFDYVTFTGSGEAPAYTVTAHVPLLKSSVDPRSQLFNLMVHRLLNESIGTYLESVRIQHAQDALSSSIELNYEIEAADNGIYSILFTFTTFTTGDARPGVFSYTMNYVYSTGEFLSLGDLFLPDSDYLGAISNYCLQELQEQGTLEYPEGAGPAETNFRNWNLTPDGLLITFDPYQLGSNETEIREVRIPYGALMNLLDGSVPASVLFAKEV